MQLSETLCAHCHTGLLDADAGLVEILRCGHPLHAKCTAALRAIGESPPQPSLCPTCATPFCVPLCAVTHGSDGGVLLEEREKVLGEMDAARAAGTFTDATAAIGAEFARTLGIVGWTMAPE